MKTEVVGIIYKAISKTSGKVYIGKTICGLNKRRSDHLTEAFNKNSNKYNTHFSRAIRKYGEEDFMWEILYEEIFHTQLLKLEIITIEAYSSLCNGYNMTKGGEGTIGYSHTNKAKAKMSKSKKGNSIWKGKTHTEESKAKMSKAQKGKKHTNESKAKISKSLKGRPAPNKGKTHTAETKAKISESIKCENHPQAKLNWEKVTEIRELYKTGKYTKKYIANMYEMAGRTIGRIINNESWEI